jgi:hypothetical protein
LISLPPAERGAIGRAALAAAIEPAAYMRQHAVTALIDDVSLQPFVAEDEPGKPTPKRARYAAERERA